MRNTNGVLDLEVTKNTAEENMALYDSLPPEVRREYREAAFNLMPKPDTWATRTQNLNTLQDTLRYIQRKSSTATYGASYPADIKKVRA